MLRACERFGIAPWDERLDDLAMRTLLLDYDRVRRAEEDRELEIQLGVGVGDGVS